MTGRLRLLTGGVLLVWGILTLRLVHLQWVEHERLSQHAVAQRAFEEVIPARWGDIVDRRGRLLATTTITHSLFVDPSRITDADDIASRLAKPLGLDADGLAQRIARHSNREFLWVKRRLTNTEVEEILDLDLPKVFWGLREEFCRVYPQGTLAAHVLGWRNIDGVPQAGLERTLNDWLQGIDGRRALVRDARGFVVDVLEEVTQPPRHGQTITLTLDATIQHITEDRLDTLVAEWRPQSASAVVIDPQTGEILALASRPTFDPNHPAATPPASWKNHAVSSAFEPGSTIKPCIAAWAVDRKWVAHNETFECRGTYRMGRRVLHDHHSFGTLDITGIIAKSSNIGMAQIGERLGNERLYAALVDFGFGRPTGIELPNESSGIVRPLKEWDDYSTGSIPMGQELAATPLQMIAAHAALAGGGTLITPHLVLRKQSELDEPTGVLATQILDPQTARWMTSGPMVEVVRRGTARSAAIDGLTVFAKTGTAQKFDAETGTYAEDRYVSSCLCGTPTESPRLLVLVTVDEPTSESDPFGGRVAGPAASEILKRSLAALKASPAVDPLLRITSDALDDHSPSSDSSRR